MDLIPLWGIGVLEYWGNGIYKIVNNTPVLQHSISSVSNKKVGLWIYSSSNKTKHKGHYLWIKSLLKVAVPSKAG